VRAKHLGIASDRLRAMRPVAVVVAPDVPAEDVLELERIAEQQAATVVRLVHGSADNAALRRVSLR
jgi:hypothetical protein